MTEPFTRHDLSSAPEASRALLADTQQGFGFLPAPVALMAESPELLESFLRGNATFERTTLSRLEREVLVLTVATTVECHYCVAMHSALLLRSGADEQLVAALREHKPLQEAKLTAMRIFTHAVMAGHGHVEPEAMAAFLEAGYTQRNALEVVLGVGVYTLSTYANRLTQAPLDEPFAAHAWHPGQ